MRSREESESRSLAITSCPFATAECRSRKPLPLVAATLWNPVTRKEVQPLEGNINWVEAVARICDFFRDRHRFYLGIGLTSKPGAVSLHAASVVSWVVSATG